MQKIEIEKHKESIKKLKAERIYRNKLDLHKYTVLAKKFKEFVDGSLTKSDDLINLKISKAIKLKKESLANAILSEIQNFQNKYNPDTNQLTAKDLIQHEMLTLNSDLIFKEAEIQTDSFFNTKTQATGTELTTKAVEIETDEILDFIQTYDQQTPKKDDLIYSVTVTDENQEKIMVFNTLETSSDIESSSYKKNAGRDETSKKFLNRGKSIIGAFRSRFVEEKDSQTDEKVFLEVTKKEEEELISWMIKDREDYLKHIQRQIFTKKTELAKVSNLISSQKNLLGESFSFENSKMQLSANSSFSFEASIDNEIDTLRKTGVISPDADLMSWRDGYVYGFEKQKLFKNDMDLDSQREISVSAHNSVFRNSEDFEIETSKDIQSQNKPKKNTLGVEDIKRNKKSTKIKEFHFQRKESKHLTLKNTNKCKFLDPFLDENIKNIIKHTKISRKMLIRTISSIYVSATKTKIQELESLADFVYDEFCSRYGQKIVVKKKLLDFISGLLKYPNSRLVINFIKLMGISHKIGLEDYIRPKESFKFLITFNRMVEKSNLGILSVDDIADYQFIPSIRAIECSKELLSTYFDLPKVQSIVSTIEKNSLPDPKKINKFGIVDLENLKELLLTEYNELNKKIMEELVPILRFLYNIDKKVHKLDIAMIIRHISPDKYDKLFSNSPALPILSTLARSKPQKEFISLSKVLKLCFEYFLVYPSDIETFVKNNNNSIPLLDKIKSMYSAIQIVFNDPYNHGVDSTFKSVWEERIKSLDNNLVHNRASGIVWNVFILEINRILKEI